MSEQTAEQLVADLAGADWQEAYAGLEQIGHAALPEIRSGLRHGNWRVRRNCLIFLDHYWDDAALEDVIALLRDPMKSVRLFALHALVCDRCKDGYQPVDPLPYILERLEVDESIKVRRHATACLTLLPPTDELARIFEATLANETDVKMRKHAEWGLHLCRKAGLR